MNIKLNLQKGLIAHFPLDKESFNPNTRRFTDKSAFCNHGIGSTSISGSSIFQNDHMDKTNRATQFNGLDRNINCSSGASLDIDNNEFSLSAWIDTENDGDILNKFDCLLKWQVLVILLHNQILE